MPSQKVVKYQTGKISIEIGPDHLVEIGCLGRGVVVNDKKSAICLLQQLPKGINHWYNGKPVLKIVVE